ncbi:MAG TPA: DNA recombination protein RmuC [Casimicrobiaceae bacterium]
MPDTLALAVVALLVIIAVLVAVAMLRLAALARVRDDAATSATRESAEFRTRLDALNTQIAHVESDIRQDLANARAEQSTSTAGLRSEVGGAILKFREGTQQQLTHMAEAQHRQLQGFGEQLIKLTTSNDQRLEAVRVTVEQRLDALRNDNTAKLDQMRATVDEKLQATLEQRLGESFKIVSDRLEQVHRGLGEMQTLATGVGDLKRVLTNVKSRGGWGEVQLGALLEEMLSPGQFARNVATRPGSRDVVEYAVKLPGRGDDGTPCWLPIDAKFPLDDYQRLQDAIEHADGAAVEASRKALEMFFKAEARKIRDKYVAPPHTTDFAILFIPTEGLYAEAVSRAGLADTLQREFKVMLAGPMNLAAMLNSLQLGFRTLAIEQRSTEVWRVLGAVKTEFGKFGEILAKTKEKLDQVGRTLDDAGRKSTTIARKLRDVEALPEADADLLLTGDAATILDLDEPPREAK